MQKHLKVIVEKHQDGYVAYPLGLKGVVVGAGDSYEEALADVKSAIRFHIETFGPEVLEDESPVFEAFVAEGPLEDIALAHAIEQGLGSAPVSREEVCAVSDGAP
jgi:predicted RNase H-like HicB family nuclease